MGQSSKAYKAAWYQRNKARVREQRRITLQKWRAANPDKWRAQRQRAYQSRKRRGVGRAQHRRWLQENAARVRYAAARWRERNREQLRRLNRKHYRRNRKRIMARVADWQRRNCAAAGNWYVRHKLSRGRIPMSVWPDSLVQCKGQELKLRRLIKWQRQQTSNNCETNSVMPSTC